MSRIYFCGSDLYNCLPKLAVDLNSDNNVFNELVLLAEYVSKVEYFNHSYAIFQKKDCPSWFVKVLGDPEIEIFQTNFKIVQVVGNQNSIVGLSEDGKLYRISLSVAEDYCDLSLHFSNIQSIQTDIKFKKIVSNDISIFGLETARDVSKIYKIDEGVKLEIEFPEKIQIVDFEAGYGHFVALSDAGAVWNWGYSGRSELAYDECNECEISSMKKCETPLRISFFDDLPCIVTKIACGGWHTLALTSDGDVYTWGWNESGQLGHAYNEVGNMNDAFSKTNPYPVDLGSAEDPIVDIAAGSKHSSVLLKSGKVYSWGRIVEGQGGCGKLENASEFITTPLRMIEGWNSAINFNTYKIKCGMWSTFVHVR